MGSLSLQRPTYEPRPRYVPYVRSDVLLRQRMTFEHVHRKRQHEEEAEPRDEKRAHAPNEKNKEEVPLESSAESVRKGKNGGGSAESGVVEKAKEEDRDKGEPENQEERRANEAPEEDNRRISKRVHVRFPEEHGERETAEERNATAGKAQELEVERIARVVPAVPVRAGNEMGKTGVALTDRSELTRNGQAKERNGNQIGNRNVGSRHRAEGALPGAPTVQNAVPNAPPRSTQAHFQKAADRSMVQQNRVGMEGGVVDRRMPQPERRVEAEVTSYTGQVLEAAALLGALSGSIQVKVEVGGKVEEDQAYMSSRVNRI